MPRSCFAVSVLLMLAVTASAISRPTDHEEPQAKRILMAEAHLQREATTRLAAASVKLASAREAEKKDGAGDAAAVPLEARPSGGVATQGDDHSSSSGAGSTGGEHGKEEGNSKEGEKQAKSCLSKEECHKKRLLCGKGCTLSAHTKCAAKCSRSCVPTC